MQKQRVDKQNIPETKQEKKETKQALELLVDGDEARCDARVREERNDISSNGRIDPTKQFKTAYILPPKSKSNARNAIQSEKNKQQKQEKK